MGGRTGYRNDAREATHGTRRRCGGAPAPVKDPDDLEHNSAQAKPRRASTCTGLPSGLITEAFDAGGAARPRCEAARRRICDY
jgi:hypothetical protein